MSSMRDLKNTAQCEGIGVGRCDGKRSVTNKENRFIVDALYFLSTI